MGKAERTRIGPSSNHREPSALTLPLAMCLGAVGYNHLVHVEHAEEYETAIYTTTNSSSDVLDHASVVQSASIEDQNRRHPSAAAAAVAGSAVERSSLADRRSTTVMDESTADQNSNSSSNNNTNTLDESDGVLKNSTPLFEALRQCEWQQAIVFLQAGSVCSDIATDATHLDQPGMRIPLSEQVRTWVSMYHSNGSLVWRRLPLHDALCRGAPVDLVYALLELYPLAAEAPDSEGNLTLHLAMAHNSSSYAVQMILQEYPKAIEKTNDRGQLPLECVYKKMNPTNGQAASSPMRGQVLQRYVNSAKHVAHQHVPKLKGELFQVNKTIEAAKSELRLAKVELGMIKEQKRLMAERKAQEDVNMKEEVMRLRAELETLRCEREQLSAEKELWTERCEQQKQQWAVAEALSEGDDSQTSWIATEFSEMVSELEQTSRLVKRGPTGQDSAEEGASPKAPTEPFSVGGDIFPPRRSGRETMHALNKLGDFHKMKKDTELKECQTDTTEMSYDAFVEKLSSHGDDDMKQSARLLSEDNEVSSISGASKISQNFLSIMQEHDDDELLKNTPSDELDVVERADKILGELLKRKKNAAVQHQLTDAQEKMVPDNNQNENCQDGLDGKSCNNEDEQRRLDAIESMNDALEVAKNMLGSNLTDEITTKSPGDETMSGETETEMELKPGDSLEDFIKSKSEDQTQRRKHFAVRWNSNAMADDLVNFGTEVEDSEKVDADGLGPLIKAKARKGRRGSKKEERRKKLSSRKSGKVSRERRDEGNFDERETTKAEKGGRVSFAKEAVTIEEPSDFSHPFYEFDDAVDKTLTKISRRTSRSSPTNARSHRSGHRGRSKSRSHSKRRERNIYVADEDKVEILTSNPQLSFESGQTSSSFKTIASSAEAHGRRQLMPVDSSSVAGYSSLA